MNTNHPPTLVEEKVNSKPIVEAQDVNPI